MYDVYEIGFVRTEVIYIIDRRSRMKKKKKNSGTIVEKTGEEYFEILGPNQRQV